MDTGWIVATAIICLLIGGFVGTGIGTAGVNCEVCKPCPKVNNTVCDNTEILDILNKDSNWEDKAQALVEEEYSGNKFKEIYKAIDDLFGDIDEKEDIEKVVVKDTDFSSMDAEDENAEVTQKIKVYYENLDGDDKKVYFIVEAEIEEGEVEDLEITEA